MSKRTYTYNHSLILFLKILCTFNYSDGILRLWDKHKTRATVNKIMKTLKFNYDEYNSLMKTLEPFNAIYEVIIGGKRFIQIDERIINYRNWICDRQQRCTQPVPGNLSIPWSIQKG